MLEAASFFFQGIISIYKIFYVEVFNPLNAKLNPICHLLALLGAHLSLHVSRIRIQI